MAKVSMPISNDYFPQTLFLYGTYDKEGKPDFGLFCWFSYAWDTEVIAMCAIGGEKLTKDNIHEGKVFSANLVTEAMLPMADYFGNTDGRKPEKMRIDAKIEKGSVLNVPVLTDSPIAFELEAYKFIQLDDSEVMLCRIRNVIGDKELADNRTPSQKLDEIKPVRTTCSTYFGWDGRDMGAWGSRAGEYKKI